MPQELPEYRAVWNPEDDLDSKPVNYWEGLPLPETLSSEVENLLPSTRSWSSAALMYGVEDGNRIEIWKGESIRLRFDLRTPNITLLRAVVALAQENDLIVVSDTQGKPMQADLHVILEDIRHSDAYRFCVNPLEFLRGLTKDKSSEQEAGPYGSPAAGSPSGQP